MRKSILYQPLAVLLTILMLPEISRIAKPSGDRTAAPFQAAAQIQVCGSAGSDASLQQIVNTCPWSEAGLAPTDLIAFQDDTIAGYLAEHGLPASDRSIIFDYGRAGLRTEIRSKMEARLENIILTPQASRTPLEQRIYQGFQKFIQPVELLFLTETINEWNRWRADPCTYTVDPDVALAVGISYSGAPYCNGGLATIFNPPPLPGNQYFQAVGLKRSYSDLIKNHAISAAATQFGVRTAVSIGAATGAGVGTLLVTTTAITVLSGQVGVAAAAAVSTFSPVVIETAVAAAPAITRLFAASASGMVTLATIVGVIQGFQVFDNQTQLNQLNALSARRTTWQNGFDDLSYLLDDAIGRYRLNAAFTRLVTPDVPSTAPLPVHRPGIDPSFIREGDQPNEQITYKDWLGFTWTLSTYGGWFVQTMTGSDGVVRTAISPTIYFVDYNGVRFTASRKGTNFIISKDTPAATDKVCPANPLTGVTTPPDPDFSKCSDYVWPFLKVAADDGVRIWTWSLALPPSFTSPSSANFTPGVAKTFDITTSGGPGTFVSWQGTLPAGLSFTQGNPVKLSGTAAPGTEGDYPITLTARNSIFTVTQNFVIHVGTFNLVFTSPAEATFSLQQPDSFTIRTTGTPKPSLSIGRVPPGMTFRDNGDGTATLSGTPTSTNLPPGTIFACPIGGCGVTATNAFGSLYQNLKVYVVPVPLTIAALAATRAVSGLPFTVTAGGTYCGSIGSYNTSKSLSLDKTLDEACAVKFEPIISAGTGTRYLFKGWNDQPTSVNPRTFTMPSTATTYTANFEKQNFLTTSASAGGTISESKWMGVCFDICVEYVTATPAAGYAFTGFSGDFTSTANPLLVPTDAPHSVKANFGVATAIALSPSAGKYSDTVTLSATVSALSPALNSTVAGSLQFSVNGVTAGTVAISGAGIYTVPYTITQSAGPYPVNAVFTPRAGVVGGSATNILTVSPKTATVTPSVSNPIAMQVAAPGGTGSFQMKVTIAEVPGGGLGDISKTSVTFTFTPLVPAPPLSCPVTTTVAAGILTAVATCTNVPVNVYHVTATVGGSYYTGSTESVIAVFDPSLGDVSGAGTLLHNGVSANFEANVKYKKDAQLQGAVKYMEHRPAGKLTLKSDSVQSMSIAGNTAVIVGKATLDGVGNYSFQATVTGNGSSDLFGLQVTDPSGRVVPELTFPPINLKSGTIKMPK